MLTETLPQHTSTPPLTAAYNNSRRVTPTQLIGNVSPWQTIQTTCLVCVQYMCVFVFVCVCVCECGGSVCVCREGGEAWGGGMGACLIRVKT